MGLWICSLYPLLPCFCFLVYKTWASWLIAQLSWPQFIFAAVFICSNIKCIFPCISPKLCLSYLYTVFFVPLECSVDFYKYLEQFIMIFSFWKVSWWIALNVKCRITLYIWKQTNYELSMWPNITDFACLYSIYSC